MSFLKQKEQEFNFFTKSKEKKKKKISAFDMILCSFFALQFGFLSANVNNLEKKIHEKQTEYEQIYESYSKVREFIKTGDQNQIILNYAQLDNHTYISQILAGSLLQMIVFYKDNTGDKSNKNIKNINKEYQINVQPETINTLKNIYDNSLKSTKKDDTEWIQNCNIFDISCHLMNHYQDKYSPQLKKIQNDSILKVTYNINHPEEYNKWLNDLETKKEKHIKLTENDYQTPGDKYVKEISKKTNK